MTLIWMLLGRMRMRFRVVKDNIEYRKYDARHDAILNYLERYIELCLEEAPYVSYWKLTNALQREFPDEEEIDIFSLLWEVQQHNNMAYSVKYNDIPMCIREDFNEREEY